MTCCRTLRPVSVGAALALLGASVSLADVARAVPHEGEGAHVHAEDEAPADTMADEPDAADFEKEPTAEPGSAAPPPGEEPARGGRGERERVSNGASGEAGGDWEPRTIDDTDWRRSSTRPGRDDGESDWLDPTHFLFELRFGPYSPEVDEEFDGATSYADIFGDDARFYFGLELDWLPLHIPYVGSLGAAFGWGYTSSSGAAVVESTGAEAGSETSLSIHPMHVSGVLRLDGLLRRYRVPIVPYVKLGLGFGVWTASGPNGTSEVDGVSGEGTSLGLHTAIGGAIALNAFDASAAVAMREETGIRYAYLYGEWMGANLDGIGDTPQMHVGTSTVVLGLALDF